MIEIESKTNKKNLQDEMENVQILQDLQEGIVDLTVKSQNGRYTFDVCVMDLLDCDIAYEKVSHDINFYFSSLTMNWKLRFFYVEDAGETRGSVKPHTFFLIKHIVYQYTGRCRPIKKNRYVQQPNM